MGETRAIWTWLCLALESGGRLHIRFTCVHRWVFDDLILAFLYLLNTQGEVRYPVVWYFDACNLIHLFMILKKNIESCKCGTLTSKFIALNWTGFLGHCCATNSYLFETFNLCLILSKHRMIKMFVPMEMDWRSISWAYIVLTHMFGKLFMWGHSQPYKLSQMKTYRRGRDGEPTITMWQTTWIAYISLLLLPYRKPCTNINTYEMKIDGQCQISNSLTE